MSTAVAGREMACAILRALNIEAKQITKVEIDMDPQALASVRITRILDTDDLARIADQLRRVEPGA